MEAFTLTIIGGVIVGVVILFLEYGYFQKRKAGIANQKQLEKKDEQPVVRVPEAPTIQNLVSETRGKEGVLPWPDAINKATESFKTLHPGRVVHVISTNADEMRADLLIMVWTRGIDSHDSYSIVVDKTGEITRIKKNH